jgi:hypothetical protein
LVKDLKVKYSGHLGCVHTEKKGHVEWEDDVHIMYLFLLYTKGNQSPLWIKYLPSSSLIRRRLDGQKAKKEKGFFLSCYHPTTSCPPNFL